jgi:hypothetical protein
VSTEDRSDRATPQQLKRWRLQFTVRTLLLMTAVVAVLLGSQGWRARRQQEAVAALEKLGCYVVYDFEEDRCRRPYGRYVFYVLSPIWDRRHEGAHPLSEYLGRDYLHKVVAVLAFGDAEMDHVLPHLEQLPYLEEVAPDDENAVKRLQREMPQVEIVRWTLGIVG